MLPFAPRFTITNTITADLTTIERARGFLDAATLSQQWIERMSQRALLLEAHHTTHIEGTELTLDQAEQLWAGETVAGARRDDVRERVEWLRAETGIHPALVAGIAQFQLVHIHPFVDGNGRTSRLLSTLCLCRAGYDFKRLFTLSEYYDRDRSQFYTALQGVREQDMDMTGWLEYLVDALAGQLEEVKQRGTAVIRAEVMANTLHLNTRQKLAMERLLETGMVRVEDMETICPGVHLRTLQRDLQELVAKGLATKDGSARATRYLLAEAPDGRLAASIVAASRQVL
ncbi:MAG: Fic family protein [Armatimonadetes bacterium CG07_land_8_20_14_0_80_59_28]|nr:MAG: Fic family protein [Armatimonadetes bacterium CG07_land_8_20_14_0_80_59_28]PIY43488.1 MAG: Fic family protein [Armatimonadetes bacterium CG_4_10_14_3_um_filter_59_10]PJB69082.1 MAG: Fic family protein [Armatimonadetes bacterium CG_4_9_14_3_um_filter_58_7]